MAKQQRCRVVRGFRHKAEIQGPSSVLDLDTAIAIELRTANKVEFVASDVPLKHSTTLPDPNRILADRQAARARAIETTTAAAKSAAGGK